MQIFDAKVVRMKLGASHVRLALFKILTAKSTTPLHRTIALLYDHELVQEAGLLVEWRIKHELGTLTFEQVKF